MDGAGSVNSSAAKFSASRSARVDLGRTTSPCCRAHPSSTCAGEQPISLATPKPLERSPRVEALARHGPVQEQEVDVVEAHPRERRLARPQRPVVALVVVPDLRGDKDLVAREPRVAEAVGDVGLVSVHTRGVDVTVPACERVANDPPRLVARRRVEHAEPDLWNAQPASQR
jgi:hypothetical protein